MGGLFCIGGIERGDPNEPVQYARAIDTNYGVLSEIEAVCADRSQNKWPCIQRLSDDPRSALLVCLCLLHHAKRFLNVIKWQA